MYKNVLVPLDSTYETEDPFMINQALTNVGADGTLHITSIVPKLDSLVAPYVPANAQQNLIEEARGRLQALVKQADDERVKLGGVFASDSVYHEVLREAKKINADLIVTSAHKGDPTDYLLGTNAAKIVRHAHCSVLVIRSPNR